jgi:hypothetical protein
VTHLRKNMLEELQRRHYSEGTTRYYIRHVERFARHFNCSPDRDCSLLAARNTEQGYNLGSQSS